MMKVSISMISEKLTVMKIREWGKHGPLDVSEIRCLGGVSIICRPVTPVVSPTSRSVCQDQLNSWYEAHQILYSITWVFIPCYNTAKLSYSQFQWTTEKTLL
jgi:hypothetical protein